MAQEERFRFRDDVLRTAASRTRRRLLVSLIATAGAVVGVWAAVLRPRGGTAGSLAFALALLVLLAFFSLRRRLRRLVARWSSFEVAVGDEGIGREVDGFPPIAIPRSDVAAVEERATGIVVRARSGTSLLVPRELQGYERVRDLLAGWAPPPGGSSQG
jgi:hypothetical protein